MLTQLLTSSFDNVCTLYISGAASSVSSFDSDESDDYSTALKTLIEDDEEGLQWLTVLGDAVEPNSEYDGLMLDDPADVQTLVQAVQFLVVRQLRRRILFSCTRQVILRTCIHGRVMLLP